MSAELPPGFTLDAAPTDLPPGFTVDAGHPTTGPSGDWWTDLKRYLGSTAINTGIALRGMIPDSGVSIPRLGERTGPTITRPVEPSPGTDVREMADYAYNNIGMPEYIPATEMGRIGQGAISGAILGMINPTTLPAAIAGGAASQGVFDLIKGQGGGDKAAAIGSLVAGLGAGGLANRGAQALIGPTSANVRPEKAALAERAQGMGIPITTADISENPMLAKRQQMLEAQGFPRSMETTQAQRQAFNRRVTAQMGEDAPAPTPEVMQRARTRIGGVFDRVAADTEINPQATNGLAQNLAAIETEARSVLTDAEFGPLRRQMDNVLSTVQQGGSITGESYQALTRRGAPLDVAQQSNNPNIAHYASRIRAALDDALEQSATPENVAALRTARQQWRAMRTIEANLKGADTQAAAVSVGDVNPATLYRQVQQSYDRFGGANPAATPLGQNEMVDLGKIGQGLLKAPNTSGTPEGIMAGMPTALRIARQPFVGSVNYIADMLLNSPRLANRQINAALHPPSVVFQQPNPLVQALLAERAAQLGTHPPSTQ